MLFVCFYNLFWVIVLDVRERVFAALEWRDLDYVPWIVKSGHLPRGEWERLLRNRGLGVSISGSVFRVVFRDVVFSRIVKGDYIYNICETPVGNLREVTRTGLPSEGGERSDKWVVEHMVKSVDDFKVLEYLFEDMIFEPCFRDFEMVDEALGGDGVAYAGVGYSPLMELIVRYMGFRNFARVFKSDPGRLEDVLEVIHEKKLEVCRLVAESPARIVLIGDNIDEVLVDHRLFRKYCVPFYQEYTDVLRSRGKIVGSHMDGRLRSLRELIAEAGFDFIHGFTPPPGGNLGLGEARESWGRTALWVNIPEVVFYEDASSIVGYVRGLLGGDCKRGLILGITETVPPSERVKGYTAVLEAVLSYGKVG